MLCIIICTFAFLSSCERNDLLSLAYSGALKTVIVSPADTLVSPGESISFKALAVYSDDSVKDVTSQADWNVSGSCTLTGKGAITSGAANGTFIVQASYSQMSGSGSGTIAPAASSFVSISTGNDTTGTGLSRSPYQTIGKAYTVNPTGAIIIAAGNYNLSSPLSINTTCFLFGGYSPADWSRNISANKTFINDASGSAGLAGTPAAPIIITANNPTLNGLYINGGSTGGLSYTTAVRITSGSPILVVCILNGGSGLNESIGLYGNSANPKLQFCVIRGGAGSAPLNAYGIILSGSAATLSSFCSLIFGENGTVATYGIYSTATGASNIFCYNGFIVAASPSSATRGIDISNDCTAYICNNTILSYNTVAVSTAYGIVLNTAANTTRINNNIIEAAIPSGSSWGVYENSAASYPVELQNNLFYLSTYVYHEGGASADYGTTAGDITLLQTTLGGSGTTTGANLYTDPLFISTTDLHLQSGSPARNAGINGITASWPNFPTAAGIPIDLGSNPRPLAAPWSIGAYE